MEQQQPAYLQPQYVMMQAPPQSSTNWLGVFGFLFAVIGIFIPTGVVSLIGVAMCLGALSRPPRGFAIFGLIIGLLSVVGWVAVMIAALIAAVVGVAAVGTAFVGGFVLTQPETVEVTADMINIGMALEEYADEHNGPPAELAALPLGEARLTDPWGTGYRVIWTQDEDDIDIVSAGPDRTFDTEDDIRASRLDDYWEDAWERYEEQMERMDRSDGGAWGSCGEKSWDCDWSVDCESGGADATVRVGPRSYEDEAKAMIESGGSSSRVWVGDEPASDEAGEPAEPGEIEIIIETHGSTTREKVHSEAPQADAGAPKAPPAAEAPPAPSAPAAPEAPQESKAPQPPARTPAQPL